MKKHSIPIKYGIALGVILILYFVILSIIGWSTNPFFSFVNAAITAVGIYLSIRSYRRHKGSKFRYHKGFFAGIFTGFYATAIFTVFFGIYFSNNDSFAQELSSNIGVTTNAALLILGVALMGFASTLVVTLTLMQLFKDSWNTREGNRHAYHKDDDYNRAEDLKKPGT